MNVLVACEFSGIVRNAFRNKGHDAWSCDLLPALDNSEYHIQGDVLQQLGSRWDLMIAHPPCTYLCNSGVRWLHGNKNYIENNPLTGRAYEIEEENRIQERWTKMYEAVRFFNELSYNSRINKVCVENPIPHKYAKYYIGEYTQLIQPWQFGHGETKATCLWLQNLPELVPTNIVEGREPRIHRMAPSKDRGLMRSITYQGIANAMAEQWG